MGVYRTVLVGTDGSESSLRAVERAGQLASSADSRVVVASAYSPLQVDLLATDTGEEGADSDAGNAPLYQMLRAAGDRAKAAGAINVEERAIVGTPAEALVALAEDVGADLLVVGSLGLSTIAGRLLGSVPADVARRATIDVLIVHTTKR